MDVVSFEGLGWEFLVNRVAFRIGNFNVYWYGILIGLGLLLGVLYALGRAKEFGIDSDRLLDVVIVGVIAGVIGARLYYIIFAEPGTFTSFAQWFDLRHGGLAFYGCVIAVLISSVIVCRIRKVNLLAFFDIMGIGLLIGQGLGRWGNFFNQEAFGINTDLPWGMSSSTITTYLASHMSVLESHGITVDPFAPVHPTFLYESLWCLLGVVLFSLYVKHRKFDGEMFLMYLVWNGSARAIIEGLRTDSLYLGNVRISQLLAAIVSIAALVAIIFIRSKISAKRKAGETDYMIPYGHTQEWAECYETLQAERSGKKKEEEPAEAEAAQAEAGDAETTEEAPAEGSEAEEEESAEEKELTVEDVAEAAAVTAVSAVFKDALSEEAPAETEESTVEETPEEIEEETPAEETAEEAAEETAEETTAEEIPEEAEETEAEEKEPEETEEVLPEETEPETVEEDELTAEEAMEEESASEEQTEKTDSETEEEPADEPETAEEAPAQGTASEKIAAVLEKAPAAAAVAAAAVTVIRGAARVSKTAKVLRGRRQKQTALRKAKASGKLTPSLRNKILLQSKKMLRRRFSRH